MEPFVLALVANGLIGGADVIVNHELIARLPARRNSTTEQWLHSARELIFATLFLALAWSAWHGLGALVIVALLLAEFAVSTVDTVLEFDVRRLPVPERIAHVLLFVNFGILVTLLGQALLVWSRLPTAVVAVDYGAFSWALSGLAGLAFGWSIRDAASALRHRSTVGSRSVSAANTPGSMP